MQYTVRTGDRPEEAHINYACPCGCTAGLIYERASGPMEVGECCCGRLLSAGVAGEATVRSNFGTGVVYELELDNVTLPWGETVMMALAVPEEEAEQQAAAATTHAPATVRDVVCGMTIDPNDAAGTSIYKGHTYYFCATVCKTRFEADPERYLSK